MQSLTNLLKKSPYILGAITLVLTVISAGCQPTATYRGEDLTRPQLEARVQADLRSLQLKADNAGTLYEAQINEFKAEEEAIITDGQVAAADIDRKQQIWDKGLSFVANTVVSLGSGGSLNTGDTIKTGVGLAMALFGVGGFGTAVSASRGKRKSDEALNDVVKAIDKAKGEDGIVNFKDPATKTALDANMGNATIDRVKEIREG